MIRLTSEISEKQLSWRNDPRINAWTRQNGILTESEHSAWQKKIQNDQTIRMFGVSLGSDTTGYLGEDIGTCGLTSINYIHRTAEFSLFIAPEYRGHENGKKALIELLNLGFFDMNLETIYGETFVGNPALKLFKELGMQEEGIHRKRYEKNGKRIDAIPISITREEWKQQPLSRQL